MRVCVVVRGEQRGARAMCACAAGVAGGIGGAGAARGRAGTIQARPHPAPRRSRPISRLFSPP